MSHLLARRIAVGALVVTAACDVPTGIPHWQEAWNLPAKNTTIAVSSLLPSGVAITPDSSAFRVNVAPVSITRQLGQDCAACAAANGTTVPKPAFTMTASDSTALPTAVDSATLAADTLTVTVANGFDFDPIRPGAGAYGSLVLTVSNGSATVGRDSVNGATSAIPAGGSLVRKIPLAGTVAGSASLTITATLDSPQGDPVLMNSADSITVTASTGDLLLSRAQVAVQNQSVTAAPVSLDLSGISSSVSSRVQSGTLELSVTNPFAVQGAVTLYLTGKSSAGQQIDINKSAMLSDAAASIASVDFTQAEVQQLIGAHLVLQLGGTVSGPSGRVTVMPRQAVTLATRFQIVVNTEATH